MEYEDNIYDPNTPLFGVAEEEDDTYETTDPFAPSEYGALPSNMGTQALNYMNLGLQVGVRSLQQKYAAAEERLRQKIEGGESRGARMERLLTLAAALGRPTKTGSFGEELSNFTEAYAQTVGAQRQRREALEDKLAELQAAKAASIGDLQAKYLTELGGIAAKSVRPYSSKAVGSGYEVNGKRYVDVQDAEGNITPQLVGAAGEPDRKVVPNAKANGQPVLVDKKGKFYDQAGNPVTKFDEPRATLSAAEQRKLMDTEEAMAGVQEAIRSTQLAMQLNKTAYAGALGDINKGIGSLFADNNSQEYKDTEAMNNLLKGLALSQLKATFPGAISNDERKALVELQGAGSLSRPAREQLFKQKLPILMRVLKKHQDYIRKLKRGYYSERVDEGAARQPTQAEIDAEIARRGLK